MKAAIIGASEEALHTIKRAKEQGLTVFALDGNPEAAGLKEADKAIIVDISDEAKTIEAVRSEEPDFLLTVPIGRYLTTTGAVNDALKLPGVGKQAAVNCTDKWLFHQLLAKEGLRDCSCYLLRAEENEKKDIRESENLSKTQIEQMLLNIKNGYSSLRYPAIMKPRHGSGSRGIFVVNGYEELQACLLHISEAGIEEDYILEECVQGDEYGVDGVVIDGKFHLILLRKKENTPFPARQAVAYFSVLPQDRFYMESQEYMRKVAEVLGLQECLVHGDLIRKKDGPFAIEISARPSGHNLHNLFTPLASGVDMTKEYICYRMEKAYDFTTADTKMMMIHYFDLEGKVEHIPDEGDVRRHIEKLQMPEGKATLVDWSCKIKPGDVLNKVSDGHSLMGRGYYILEGTNEEALKKAVNMIKSLFH